MGATLTQLQATCSIYKGLLEKKKVLITKAFLLPMQILLQFFSHDTETTFKHKTLETKGRNELMQVETFLICNRWKINSKLKK